jgi:cytochrome c553
MSLMNTLMKRAVIAVVCIVLGAVLSFDTSRSLQAQGAPPLDARGATPARQLVTTYCISCHNQKLRTANLALDTADAEQIINSAQTWEKVVVQLRSRSMPPPRARRPDGATYEQVAGWLESELDRAAAANPNPGRPLGLHRLNRTEYANAIRDLLGIEIDGTAMLPPDEQAHGFDNIADALTVTPALQMRYLTASAKISRLAVGDPTIRPGFERYTAAKHNSNERTQLWHHDRFGEEFPLGTRGGIVARHYFPVDGEYVFRIRLERTIDGDIHGLHVPSDIDIRVDGVRVAQFKVGRGSADLADKDELETRIPLKAGLRQVIVTVVKSEAVRPEGLGPARTPIWSEAYGEDPNAQLIVPLLLIGGPYNGKVPQDSPSRARIFVCTPQTASEETPCARKILSTLAQRAYRRPLTDADTATLMEFYRRGRATGTFDAGIRAALERVLVSPDFLFRIEADPAQAPAGTAYRVSDVELASRLSFFLWSSIPDDELLELAIEGKLRDPGVIEKQTRRMLADPRARSALVGNFFSQWLQVRNVWLLTPDLNRKFPWFDDNLRSAFVRETELFLDSQLQEDQSVVGLLTADHTFLNEDLARHYGVPGVYGSHFRRVKVNDENRRGLLGQASILAVTSYPHRTSPTIRGKWLLENILAAPVPPPPPDVDTTLEEGPSAKPATVREMLERHRANPVCASCHARMDPIGFTLENFDSLGRWRLKDGDADIDASGVLMDGAAVKGPSALRAALVQQKEQFVKAVTGKLLMYAVGRELHHYDTPAVRSIVKGAAADDYRWSSVILGIVKSTPFQFRRSRS